LIRKSGNRFSEKDHAQTNIELDPEKRAILLRCSNKNAFGEMHLSVAAR
jgi:hypothetical protein